MSNVFLSVDFIEQEMARTLSAGLKGNGGMKRLARRLAHSSVSSLSKQLTDSDSRSPLQLRVLLMLRESDPGLFHKGLYKLCEFLGYKVAPERSPDGMKIEIRGQLDQVEIAFLEVRKETIRTSGTGLAPMDRKVVRDRIEDLKNELDELSAALEVRPVEYLYDALEG